MTQVNKTHFGWGKSKSRKWWPGSFVFWLVASICGTSWPQVPTSVPIKEPTESRLSDTEWTTKIFQNLILPLSIEEITILQKQLQLTTDQTSQIKNLSKLYQTQQMLWKRLFADTSGNYGHDENATREDGEKAEKNHKLCLEAAKKLRDSLNPKDSDFLDWLNEEDVMRSQLPKIKGNLKNATPEDIAAAFVKAVNQHQKPGIKRSADQDWWLGKRALLFVCDLSMPMGKRENPKEIELNEKQKSVFREMMTH